MLDPLNQLCRGHDFDAAAFFVRRVARLEQGFMIAAVIVASGVSAVIAAASLLFYAVDFLFPGTVASIWIT